MPSQAAVMFPPSAEAQTERFRQLVAVWKTERGATSSIEEMAMHPAYQQIIGLGPAAVPLLLGEMQREPDHWFWALKAITGADPVPPASRGRIRDMTQAWLQWGRANKLC